MKGYGERTYKRIKGSWIGACTEKPLPKNRRKLRKLEGGINLICAADLQEMEPIDMEEVMKHVIESESVDLWHRRAGHPSWQVLMIMNNKGRLRLKSEEIDKHGKSICDCCVKGKAKRKPVHRTGNKHPLFKPIDVGIVVCIDLFGPSTINKKVGKDLRRVPIPSINGDFYGLIMIEVYARRGFGEAIKNKSQATGYIILWLNQIERETGRVVQYILTDNAGDLGSKELQDHLNKKGIQLLHPTSYRPEHNSIVERMVGRTRMQIRTLLISADAPLQLWNEAFYWAIHLQNCLPMEVINHETPFERFGNYRFDLDKLKPWGCDAYVVISEPSKTKIQSQVWLGIFVGWSRRYQAYRILNQAGKVLHKIDVTFNENSYKAMEIFRKSIESGSIRIKDTGTPLSESAYSFTLDEPQDYVAEELEEAIAEIEEERKIEIIEEPKESVEPPDDKEIKDTVIPKLTYEDEMREKISKAIEELERRGPIKTRSGRMVKPTTLGQVIGAVFCINGEDEDLICSIQQKSSIPEPWRIPVPKTYTQALTGSDGWDWKNSIRKEYESLIENETWEIIDRIPGMKVLGCKWVFDYKLGQYNELLRRKSRLVIKGYEQEYGMDYFETHSPVVKAKTIRIILVIAAREDLELRQMDFDTAFLNGFLDELVYMEQPEGFEIGDPKIKVCKLNKSIYGLKQAARVWFLAISELLRSLSWNQMEIDPCLFVKISKTGKLMYLLLYVDDTVIALHKDDLNEWEQDKKMIANKFKIKDIGELFWILNMKVVRDRVKKTITLCQEAYVLGIIDKFKLSHEKGVPNPELTRSLHENSNQLDAEDHATYRGMIGSLLYAAITTRLDIAHAVGQLSRFLEKPTENHMKATIHVFKYLKYTSNLGLILGDKDQKEFGLKFKVGYGLGTIDGQSKGATATPTMIEAMSDSNWGSDELDRRSVTGIIMTYYGSPVSWFSKRQPTVALSSTEAEYMALTSAAQEVTWFQRWMKEVLNKDVSGLIECDNQAAIAIAKSENLSDRTKHIDIRHHFIREKVAEKKIFVTWIDTKDQLADLLTKRMPTARLEMLRSKLLVKCDQLDNSK